MHPEFPLYHLFLVHLFNVICESTSCDLIFPFNVFCYLLPLINSFFNNRWCFPFVVLLASFCDGILHSCNTFGHETFGMKSLKILVVTGKKRLFLDLVYDIKFLF